MTEIPILKKEKLRLIPDNDALHKDLTSLGPTDVFIGRLRLKKSEENLVSYLLEKGVNLFPSGLSQLCCRSKSMQARLFMTHMVPGTRVINDLNELMVAINVYHHLGHKRVVTKKDRANGGMGINLWSSVEDVFNQGSSGGLGFPFVLQPFHNNCRDIRVIILGNDYQEAYWRENPDNFRNNLHWGGKSSPAELSEDQLKVCRKVMKTGCFPYAHIDLMVTETGETFLSEINLRGGIKGASISAPDYKKRIDAIHHDYRRKLGLK